MVKFNNTNLTITSSKKHSGEKSNLKQKLSHEHEKYPNAKTATKIKILGTINPNASKHMRL
jgi:hypothetical protein